MVLVPDREESCLSIPVQQQVFIGRDPSFQSDQRIVDFESGTRRQTLFALWLIKYDVLVFEFIVKQKCSLISSKERRELVGALQRRSLEGMLGWEQDEAKKQANTVKTIQSETSFDQ